MTNVGHSRRIRKDDIDIDSPGNIVQQEADLVRSYRWPVEVNWYSGVPVLWEIFNCHGIFAQVGLSNLVLSTNYRSQREHEAAGKVV
jgi:hypothetical protein